MSETTSLFLTNDKTKKLKKDINAFYNKDNGNSFKQWLDNLKKPSTIKDGKIPGLLHTNKIKLETETETGAYNLILLWIFENKEKFSDYDFNGIPNSSFININELINSNTVVSKKIKTFKTEEDVKEWCKNPNIHPITGKEINPMHETYNNIYDKAFNIIQNKYKTSKYLIAIGTLKIHLPKAHLLFNKFDFLYYQHIIKSGFLINGLINRNADNIQILMLLSENLSYTDTKDTPFDTELELLKNRFTDLADRNIFNSSIKDPYNLNIIKNYFRTYLNGIVDNLLVPTFDFNNNEILSLVNGPYETNGINISWVKSLIRFIKNEKFSNGEIILEYCEKQKTKSNCPPWIINMLILIYKYDTFYKDINELLSKDININKTVIYNYENKKFDTIKDPIEIYFKKFENTFEIFKNPKYKKLINQETFEPISKSKYLNNKEYAEFQKEFTLKDTELKEKTTLYEKSLKEHKSLKKTNPNIKTPSPPQKRFTIKLPNRIRPFINGEQLPLHIEDSVINSFNKEYKKIKPKIDEYLKLKNMPYLDLVKYFEKNSPTEEIINNTKKNILFSMTKKQINDEILFNEYNTDESDLKNRCNSNTDVITQQEFDDENYPLAKLQLMVRLKIKHNNKYRTECLYAPEFYNYYVECLNNKTPFVNPATKIPYTEEHINELMKVMKLINPKIEKPYFLKPITDTKLVIKHDLINHQNAINDFGFQFITINLYREFGLSEHKIYDICVIPFNIEPTGQFATNSTDLASSTMLNNIYMLFDQGRLLHKYVPPYCIPIRDHNGTIRKDFIALMIHFNKYKTVNDWLKLYKRDEFNRLIFVRNKTKNEIIDMFKLYAHEINTKIY